jgi:hypothetical protein
MSISYVTNLPSLYLVWSHHYALTDGPLAPFSPQLRITKGFSTKCAFCGYVFQLLRWQENASESI